MSLRPILRWPDTRLKQRCAPVGAVTPDIRRLAMDMLETMYEAPGRGLAAPQVGEMLRLFVMDVAHKEGPPEPRVFLDPVIEARSAETAIGPEGCLSIPGVVAEVARATTITLSWRDLDGAAQRETLTGMAAICAQHEIDHLDGIVTLDRLAPDARATLEAEYAR